MLLLINCKSCFGGSKIIIFQKHYRKEERIKNILFPLQQFFEIQEYRFSLQSKFTKCFSLGNVGKKPVDNLHFCVRYILIKHALSPELWQ
jgi:hypothetical protein